MREFFRGWMALAMMGLWLRSNLIGDEIWLFRTPSNRLHTVSSVWGRVIWCSTDKSGTRNPRNLWYLWTSDNAKDCGFTSDELSSHVAAGILVIKPQHPRYWILSYWWFTIPLTLVSAYLIVWKPRKRTEPEHA